MFQSILAVITSTSFLINLIMNESIQLTKHLKLESLPLEMSLFDMEYIWNIWNALELIKAVF